MKKLFALLPSLLICICIQAQITESYIITDVLKHLDPTIAPEETLIIFDIDNTIAETTNELASPQWFSSMIRLKMKQDNLTKLEAVKQLLPLYYLVMQQATLQPIEKTIVPLIQQLQEQGYKIIGLTARGAGPLKKCTYKQLQNIDINFTRSNIHSTDIIFSDDLQYIDNTIFVNGGNKGEALLRVLNYVDYMPKKIIFVDDKEYNHHTVEGTLMQNGIDHVCLWYRYCDEKVNAFELASTEDKLLSLCEQHPAIRNTYQEWLNPIPGSNEESAHYHAASY